MEPFCAAASTTTLLAPLAKPFSPLREQILARLDTVGDPFTNLSILYLGMVDEVQIDGQCVVIVCRCPAVLYTIDPSRALAEAIHKSVGDVPGVWMIDVVMLSEGTGWKQPGPWLPHSASRMNEAELALA